VGTQAGAVPTHSPPTGKEPSAGFTVTVTVPLHATPDEKRANITTTAAVRVAEPLFVR
jgi:hypothetical protein